MKLSQKLSTHIAVCPRCSKKLRVPIKPGKTLRLSCAGCDLEFDISFKNPFLEVFQFNPSLSLKENLIMSLKRYGALPDQVRTKLMLILVASSMLVLSLLAGVVFIAFF